MVPMEFVPLNCIPPPEWIPLNLKPESQACKPGIRENLVDHSWREDCTLRLIISQNVYMEFLEEWR